MKSFFVRRNTVLRLSDRVSHMMMCFTLYWFLFGHVLRVKSPMIVTASRRMGESVFRLLIFLLIFIFVIIIQSIKVVSWRHQ